MLSYAQFPAKFNDEKSTDMLLNHFGTQTVMKGRKVDEQSA
jgi:hypothetical protein